MSGHRLILVALLIGMVTLSVTTAMADAIPLREIPLADAPHLYTVKQGWGNTGVNTAAWTPAAAPLRMRIGNTEYERGLGHHAPGEILLALDGAFLKFTAEVGVQWQGGGRGSVVFEVWVDDEKRFESAVMTDDTPAAPVSVDLAGARQLRLVAGDGGDGISCDMANWADARLLSDGRIPDIGPAVYTGCDTPVLMEGSYLLLGDDNGPQAAFCRPLGFCTLIATAGKGREIVWSLAHAGYPFAVEAELTHTGGAPVMAILSLDSGEETRALLTAGRTLLSVSGPVSAQNRIHLRLAGDNGDGAVRLTRVHLASEGRATPVAFMPEKHPGPGMPAPRDITAHPLLERELIEWDWRMQDGIGVEQQGDTFKEAAIKTFARATALHAAMAGGGRLPQPLLQDWNALTDSFAEMDVNGPADENGEGWEHLWRRVHALRRELLFAHPLALSEPLVFVKQAPAVFSHQLTQYYGRYARPGGGVYVLDAPGRSMAARRLETVLPPGSYMQPEVTHDGRRVLVAYCATDAYPEDTLHGAAGHYYHLYEISADGASLRQLTEGAFDDFSPRELPNGKIVFISTRRGGWHRCGNPGCEVYTLTLMNPDGTDIHTVSYHETQEWDPAVLNDGRVIYTRWDYVDRDAVHYQQLWVKRPDGSAPAAFYGNNTLNPAGVWEARAVPGSGKVMATAAAHHAMTAGSIILVDPTVDVDGLEPLTRLTPHVPFPETEALLLPHWRAALANEPPNRSPEMDRWPGQCYRSPWPLSEEMFLAAYSYDPLIGEPRGNNANMFGLYLVDAAGNKELLYRDLNISSVWPVPLRPRDPAPELPSSLDTQAGSEGTYYLQDVYQSDPALPPDVPITHLRIVQVLPKSTPGANNPMVGLPNASPGKQVLGTVPVESDGSAYFTAPAGVGLAFQALDASGQAVQVMRSITYLQPGERASCVGCHEPRLNAPPVSAVKTLALERAPSAIQPGPDGSLPLSYPLLVQPVLDRHCVQCHGDDRTEGPDGTPIRLTGKPEGHYTESYNHLAQRVSFSAWGRGPFPAGNSEPTTQPGFFGAKGSALARMLRAGHNDVQLEAQDWERLNTWMDANALFYGTFNIADQERQQRGERIEGPELQ